MAKFEHLLGIDPIGAFEKIKQDYVRYFENTYKVTDENVNKMRLKELTDDKKNNLYRDPYLEILPEYESYPDINGIEDLAGEFSQAFGDETTAKEFFNNFIKVGLMSYKPYGHQVEMLRKAFVDGKNVVITSGTGSGKTEAFLLPLFAQLFKEAKTWPQANYQPNWYQTRRYVPCQRGNEQRPAAVRALVLYPMNALVADQMSRLRKALDSNEVRTFMDDHLQHNRIFFGGYNGKTIAKKNYDLLQADNIRLRKEQERVGDALDKIESQYGNIVDYYNRLSANDRDDKKDVLFVNPRIETGSPTGEMLTRWDMQETPPDIMITNVSMLSIMLMRSAEKDIFRKTKEWLDGDPDKDHPTRIFHLILDELHLYRGTSGSEVACLVRMLLDTIGLKPTIEKIDAQGNRVTIPNPQLRILASSASLGSTDRTNGEKSETEKYLEEFFGVYNSNGDDVFAVQKGSNYLPQEDVDLDFSAFAHFAPAFVDLNPDQQLEQMNAFARSEPFNCNSIVEFSQRYQKTIFARIYNAIPKNVDGSPRAISLKGLADSLFGSMEALRGFLIYRAFVDKLNENGTIKQNGENSLAHRLPRIRFHQFFKYIEGLWGELHPTLNDDLTVKTDQEGHEVSPVRSVSYVPNEVGNSGNKILELLRCENCGELFIGGNRKIGANDTMSLNYPDLEKMPNFNPTPMVQNKSYQDYAIFWPTHGQPEIDLDERVALLGSGRYNFNVTNGRGKWEHAYLHTKTGEIRTVINGVPGSNLYLEGYLYYVEPNHHNQPLHLNKIQALPCSCPHCSMNYAQRISVKSPIRSFRTGIDRSNQLLSKELMYQLTEGSQKLIGFSDSREDAAKQAYGIEKEQYRDMVRMLFIDCVKEINAGPDRVIAKIEEDRRNGVQIEGNWDYLDQFDNWGIPNARQMARDYLSRRNMNIYQKEFVDLEYFIGNQNALDGMLVKKLVELGINPAGAKYADQFTNETHTDHWNRAFDWDHFTLRVNASADYRQKVYNNLTSAVFANSFGKYMGVSVLDAGIGYICCKRSEAKEESPYYRELSDILTPVGLNVYDFVDAFIRILGDNFRYVNDDFDTPAPLANLRRGKYAKYISAVADKYNLDRITLGNCFYNYFKENESNDFILEIDKIGFRLLDPKAPFYECPKCHRVHPNRGMGVCTSCCAPLPDKPVPNKTVKDLWEHFISHDILVERKQPRRLHCEELTGQTDDIQSRLLEFKNLILLAGNDEQYRKGEEMTKEIDMVNVTTTMEVGVDIGSLEAIFQGNMSPTRYNYQQRVGRGGRRGQAFSTAFTFCRGRSHDVYYYNKATDEIVGGLPAAPKLSLSPFEDTDSNGAVVYKMKLAIIKRVITKSILRDAFRESEAMGYSIDLLDTSGEFGQPSMWDNNKSHIRQWIDTHHDRIDEIIDLYTTQFNSDGHITNDINLLKNWAKCDPEAPTNIIDEVTAIANNPSYTEGLAQSLAENGLLPMYGMPSDLRNFYHGFNYDQYEIRSIDRSSEMAINEFAPGSEKTKDKGTYRVEGLTTPLRYRDDHRGGDIVPINPLDLDALRACYTMVLDPNTAADKSRWRIDDIVINNDFLRTKVDIARGLGNNEKMLIIPQAYRTYKLYNNPGEAIDSNDRSSRFSMSTIFAKDNNNNLNQKELPGSNVRVSAYGLYLNDEADVWHVNTNNNELFKGKYAGATDNIDGTEVCYQDDQFFSSNNFMFYRLSVRQGANQREYMVPIDDGQYTFDIAIGSRKPTEMVKLEVLNSNGFIDLNIETGNASAIRAAFFSAAFLIQRTLADRLDVAPDEIEITEKLIDNIPQIYLSDAAPNGAGIVSYLYQQDNLKSILEDITSFRTPFMQSLLEKDHINDCKTACQKCLLTYNNRGFHHVLDWRLGVGVLRLMLDKDFDFGFNPATRSQYQEYADYDELVVESAYKLGQVWAAGDYHNPVNNRRRVRNMIIYNPLWNKTRLIAYAKSENKNVDQLVLHNTFRVLRSDFGEDVKPENIEQIPPMGIDDQGQLIDPETNLTMGITL